MKRVIGLVFLIGAASCVGTATSASATTIAPKTHAATTHPTAKAASKPSIVVLAPADEYFGPLKESYIGMRNRIRDLGLRYDVNHDIAVQTLAAAQLTERAVHDWEKKYPRDTQIPKTIYLLQRLYTKVLTQDARNHAHQCAMWLFADYAKSGQAKQLKKTLAVEHLQPLATPNPTMAVNPGTSSGAAAAGAGTATGTVIPVDSGAAPVPSTVASPVPAAATPAPSNVSTIH